MKLTILGNNGPFPGAGEACSGYLLQEGETRILIDCGSGVLSNLQKITGFDKLTAVILSHLHFDHMADMLVLRYAVELAQKNAVEKKPLKVYAPAKPDNIYGMLDLPGVFDIAPINDNLVLDFENIRISFGEMRHPVQSFAVKASCSGKNFVYSGDTSWHEGLIDFAKGCDVLLIDAGLRAADKTGENVPHLTAEECGVVAAGAQVGKLLLTHFRPGFDRDGLLGEAKRSFETTFLTNIMESYEI